MKYCVTDIPSHINQASSADVPGRLQICVSLRTVSLRTESWVPERSNSYVLKYKVLCVRYFGCRSVGIRCVIWMIQPLYIHISIESVYFIPFTFFSPWNIKCVSYYVTQLLLNMIIYGDVWSKLLKAPNSFHITYEPPFFSSQLSIHLSLFNQ